MGDNGISAFVAEIPEVKPAPAGDLSCALSGNGVLSTFLHDKPFYTAFHVACLRPRIEMSREQILYYCAAIFSNRYRFSYGRQANRTLKSILVPSLCEIPDYVERVNITRFEGCNKPAESIVSNALDVSGWKPFLLNNLFVIKKGKRLTKANMSTGQTPFIGSTDSNNGITATVGQSPTHDGNTISLSYNGSVAEAFYQPVLFWATDDVNVLYPKFSMSPETALFICTIIRMEKYRYNYGRKWHLDRMRESIIRLPSMPQG